MSALTRHAARLSARERQPGHDRGFEAAETDLVETCRRLLPDHFEVTAHPKDLRDFYRAAGETRQSGLTPDVKICNTRTGRYLFLEVKRQGPRGNAEERTYKLFTPRFISRIREHTGLDYHPFAVVFCDDLATHPRYQVRFEAHLEPHTYLCWRDRDPNLLHDFLDAARQRWLD